MLDAVSKVGAIDDADFFMTGVVLVNRQWRNKVAAAKEGLGMMMVGSARGCCAWQCRFPPEC